MAEGGDIEVQSGRVRPRLFLSYTRADIDLAKPVIEGLEMAGFDVWWDGLLEGGVNYLPTTEAALEGADCVVVLWSERSVQSAWVRDEAQSGRERGRLVPVSIDGTMSPLGFRQIQLVDISSWQGDPAADEIKRVASAINTLIGGENAAPTIAPKTINPPTDPGADTTSPVISRRAALIGGAGIAAAIAGLGIWQFSGPAAVSENSVMAMAVLRFANLSGDEEQAWFSNGLSNELRQVLARNPLLRVSAPTSSTALEDEDDFAIGRALGVPFILRGSVQRSADMVRITAELAQVADGVIRWGETYDRQLADVFAVQSEIAETVALQLVAQVAGEREARLSLADQEEVGGTNDIRAYEAYLRGFALSDLSTGLENDRAALAQFDAAIAIDPAYAAAHAMRANQLAAMANKVTQAAEVSDLLDQSIAAANQSIELEPALMRGHLTLGFVYNSQLDRAKALPHYQRAAELAPGDSDAQRAIAVFYAYGDQQAEAMQMIDRVLELDPLNARAFRSAAFIALLARDFSKVIDHAQQSLNLNPNIASANYALGTARYMQGDIAGAQQAFESESVPLFSRVGLAITNHRRGDIDEARVEFDALVAEYGDASLYQQAQVLAQWGETDAAIEVLERAIEARDPGLLLTRNDALLDPLRNAPEFNRLLLSLSS